MCHHMTPMSCGIRHAINQVVGTHLSNPDMMTCGFSLPGINSSHIHHFVDFLVSSNRQSGTGPKSQKFSILALWIYDTHYL
jgi:hypothetical protein